MAVLTGEELANVEQLAREKNRSRNFKRLQHLARAAEVGSYLAGQHDLAEAFGASAEGAHAMGEGEGHRAGALRKAGSNFAGRQAGRMAKRRGTSGGKSAALGGAVAGALQGEGVGGIAKGAASWYFLWAAFASFWGGIFTLLGWIPGFLYLNFHFAMSKLGSKLFGEFSFGQKLQFFAIDFVAGILILLLIALVVWVIFGPIYVLCNPEGFIALIESYSLELAGLLPSSVCDAFEGLPGLEQVVKTAQTISNSP